MDIFGNTMFDSYQAITDERTRQIEDSKWLRLHARLTRREARAAAEPSHDVQGSQVTRRPATQER